MSSVYAAIHVCSSSNDSLFASILISHAYSHGNGSGSNSGSASGMQI